MKRFEDFHQRWDVGLLAAAAILALISGMAMASAASTVNPALAFRQAMWIVLGIVAALGVAHTNYRTGMDAAVIGYGMALVVLGVVLVAGTVRLGAARWLSVFGFSVQPSEFAKLTTVAVLARYLAGQPSPLPPRVVWTSMALAGLPALLVFVQPDLGSASIFMAIWFGMVFVAGASRRMLLGLSAVALAGLPFGWQLLKDYQRDRLLVFINPHADPLGAGFSIIQSTIAIGSGRLWGKGWFAGTQNVLSFLPERHSDFLFSVIGEEGGFLGCFVVVGAFTMLFVHMIRLAHDVTEPQGRLFAVGVCAWVGYQAFVNMGMVMGALPVVGVPLPLLSYGGSSMIILWTALGVLQGIHRAERAPHA